MAFPVIISFYTQDTPYQEEAQNLIASCKKFGLKTSIEGIENFGSWELNCAFKPFFILKKLEELSQPILWVDADGVFLKEPEWQKAFEGDFSVRINSELKWDHPSKVISSTIFVRPGRSGKKILRSWIIESQKSLLDPDRDLEFWDQIPLRDAIIEHSQETQIAPMPLAYSKIFDHPLDCKTVDDPVIEHYQASRRYKNFLNH